jgi:hypothetical protein
MDNAPLINRLLSGIVIFKLKGKYVKVKPARVEDKAFADFYAQEVYQEALLDGMLTNAEVTQLLMERGWWTEENNTNLQTLTKNLEQMKLDYYVNFFKEDTKQYIKGAVERQVKKINKLYETKQLFFDITCEYLRDFARTVVLTEKLCVFEDGELVVNSIPSNEVVNAVLKEGLGEETIRNMAKSYKWRSYWNAKDCTPVFEDKACNLNDEQLSLIGWSRYYDSVYESMDRPSDEVIADNLALDGWSISQDRKRKEEEKKAEGEKLLSDNMQNAGEVFVPVKSQREQDSVLALNDAHGQSVLASKKKQFEKGGSFKENELNHVRKEIQMEALRQQKESRR